ncbi:tetratricopeptide repeat protein [Flavilitoribacter nigricans]|uniref:Tetratricopeptide repeat protein n=1 Tax=Flavilitoribacter nigricans (strain ATCC 23147 / DSM 23189 / NBRC 102662 / NCIMB 1420 / SS-2) TaxID=1122177 RepID=A0A2D0MY33_FLAN2|nr:hypothetical protein [Flavilitoribacter nigricans]PHN01036.1 hypothetical protein CRP01_39215 [Flavilitoribacter nigricans DSM 23189 = NBRC 102662]
MKLITISVITLLFTGSLFNQYEAAMEAAIEKLYAAQSPEALQQAGNTFERIAKKETDKWHPHYYAAYVRIMLTTHTGDAAGKDQHLDAALEHIQSAKTLSPNNSELLALEGFIHMLRIPIDPASRGPQYSGMSMGALQKAIALDPDNPRAYLLLSDMQYGTAQFFGNGNEEACKTLQKAIDLFATDRPDHKLDPAWGEAWAGHSKKEKGC